MKTKKRILAYLLTLTLVMTSLPTQLFAQTTKDASVPMSALVDTQTTTPGAIQINPAKYVGDGYEVDFKVTNQWPGAFNGEFVLTNTSDKPLENWTLKFDFKHEITNMWNAQIVTHEANSYIIKNMGHNQDIAPGNSVNIGFQANLNDEIKAPESYDLLIAKQEVGDTDYTIDFKVTDDWGQAFNGEISITNNTEGAIEDWTLEFDFDRNIERFWTSEIVEHEGQHYIIKNAGYNANIAPGQTITLGFSGNPGNVDSQPINYVLNQLVQEIDYEKDTDNDSLPDYFEKELDTDPNKVDTDGDRLSDGYEYFLLGTDPLNADTDDDDIIDGDEDFDKDSLSNLEEYLLGTDPYNKDTDGDNLSDSSENNIYSTNPIEYDTDGDTISDGDEIELGLDPLNKYTFGILDSDYQIDQYIGADDIPINNADTPYEFSLCVTASGCINTNAYISKSAYQNTISNAAQLGNSIDIDYAAGRVTNATLQFKIEDNYISEERNYSIEDDELIGIKRFNVFKYFPEDNLMLPIETYHDVHTNMVYAEVDELGTYCIMDLGKWLNELDKVTDSEDFYVEKSDIDISLMSLDSDTKAEDDVEIGRTLITEATSIADNYMKYTFTGNTYSIIENKMTWPNAKLYCEKLGGHLVTISSKEENDFIQETLKRNNLNNYTAIGYSDIEKEGKWKWVTGEDSVYTNWDLSWPEPNNGIGMGEQDYAFMISNGTWDDGFSGSTAIFICEWEKQYGPTFDYISSTGLSGVTLKAPLKRFSNVNSDSDTLTDSDEINWDLIINGKPPTLGELMDSKEQKGYVVEGLSRMSASYQAASRPKQILPILSDPTKADGDEDGIFDDKDPNKLRKDTLETLYASKISKKK